MRRRADDTHPSEQTAGSSSNASRPNAGPGDDPRVRFPDADLIPCDVSEWVHLNQGQRIVVQRDMEYPKAGTIDLVSEDAFNFWVWLDQGEGRILVSSQDDITIWQFVLPGTNMSFFI